MCKACAKVAHQNVQLHLVTPKNLPYHNIKENNGVNHQYVPTIEPEFIQWTQTNLIPICFRFISAKFLIFRN